jgi:long-chain acyl-CoA synthetase
MTARFDNLVDLLEKSTKKFAKSPFLGTKKPTGWEWTTFQEFQRQVDALRGGLASLGVGPGDKVAIVADNRVEWAVAAHATYGRGAAFVPMYEAQEPKEWEFILTDSGSRVVFGASRQITDALSEIAERVATLEHVVGIDLEDNEPRSFAQLLAKGEENPAPAVSPAASDMAALIYTSGTTGQPKGVMLSHANICCNVNAIHQMFAFSAGDRSLTFLPWAHSFGQTCELHALTSMGCSLAINDEVPKLLDNLAEVQPHVLFAVPRIFNRIYEGVNKQMAERPALVQKLFRAGLQHATRKNRGESLGPLDSVRVKLADSLIFSKVRARFGGRLKYVVSGSAALSKEVAEFIDALGIEVYEGYGLTETSPIASANYPGHRKIGSVGKPISGVTIQIDKTVTGDPVNGEIVIYGPNVMQGYYNRPEENAKVLMDDGGLRSGDMGYLDSDGYLFITGRIKEQYKLENGKYVVPAPLEEELKLSPYIANVMLHGANKPYNVALIVLNEEAIAHWARDQGVELAAPEQNPKVVALIEAELAARAKRFKSYERPKRFVLTKQDFTTENGMLTPTLKLKRRNVLKHYEERLEALY